MAGLSGKKARLTVSTTLGGTYTVVGGLKTMSLELDGAVVDDSEFGVDWVQRIVGVNDWKITCAGYFRPTDTNGQIAVRNSLINGTNLFAKFLPDNGTTSNIGVNGQVIVTKFTGGADQAAGQDVTIELQGSGAPTVV